MITLYPKLAGSLQQHVGAVDIGLDEGIGVHDGAVNMRFRSEVDNGIHVVSSHRLSHCGSVTDVAPHENVTVGELFRHILEVVQITSIGQFVIHDDGVVGVFLQHVADEVGADEAGSAGDH